MGEAIKIWLKKPIFIYSFGLLFLIYKSASYFPSFEPLVFLGLFAGYCLINYLMIGLQKKMGLYQYGFGWLMIIWILSLFTSSTVFFFQLIVNQEFIRLRYLFGIVVLLSFLAGPLRRKISDLYISRLNQLINVFIFVFIGLILINGVTTMRYEQKHAASLAARKLPSLKIKGNKDIIWLLLDEYASPLGLRTQFNFKDPLIDSLKTKDFYVFDGIHSRSDVTLYSINSLFNLDDSISASGYMYAGNYLNKSIWVDHLEKQDYQFISLEFLTIGHHLKSANLEIFPDNYFEQVMSNSVLTYINTLNIKENKPFDGYNLKIIKSLEKEIKKKRSGPSFIWAHLLLPHAPFYRDAEGNLNKEPIENVQTYSRKEVIKQYTNYLSYGNKVILKTLNQIPDWKNKIIVISGDHGARMLIADDDPRRKQPFCAVYYPGMDKKELDTVKYLQQIPLHLH